VPLQELLQDAVAFCPTKKDWEDLAKKTDDLRKFLAAAEGARPELVGAVRRLDTWREAAGIPPVIRMRNTGN
jgi:hypothetical protein